MKTFSEDGSVLGPGTCVLEMRSAAVGVGRSLSVPHAPSSSFEPNTARLHPASCGARLNSTGWASPYLAYYDCVATSDAFIRGVTPVPPLGACIFLGEELKLEAAPGGPRMTVDDWLSVDASETTAELVVEARHAVGARLERVIDEALGDRGHCGRFDGQPLLTMVQPLLEQCAIPAEPPKQKRLQLKRKPRGGKTTRLAVQEPRDRGGAAGGTKSERKKPRRLLTKYRYGARRG